MPTTRTPEQAWNILREGNIRFYEGTSNHPNQDAARRTSLLDEQHPFAVIFGCSDSRLAAEIIFDVGLGDMFVVRTAGQVIDNAVLGSLDFSIAELAIPLIVVLGHDSCGAVTSTVDAFKTGQMPHGFMRDLVERISPSVLAAQQQGVYDVNGTVAEHTKQTSGRLIEASRVIYEAVKAGRTAVVGVTYHLSDGKAEVVSIHGNIGEDYAARQIPL